MIHWGKVGAEPRAQVVADDADAKMVLLPWFAPAFVSVCTISVVRTVWRRGCYGRAASVKVVFLRRVLLSSFHSWSIPAHLCERGDPRGGAEDMKHRGLCSRTARSKMSPGQSVGGQRLLSVLRRRTSSWVGCVHDRAEYGGGWEVWGCPGLHACWRWI